MRFYQLIAVCVLAFCITSCGGSDKPKAPKENVVIFHTIGEPDDMHPTNGVSASRFEIINYTQIFLIATDLKNSCPLPQLAAEMPKVSEDGKVYTYILRDYIKWDDGSPVTTEDVLFTYKANKCPLVNNPHAKPYLDNIENVYIDSLDKNKIVFKMKQKYIQNVWMHGDYPILQRKNFDAGNVMSKYSIPQFDDKNFNADKELPLLNWAKEFNDPKNGHDPKFLVGAGPYKFDKWEPGQSIIIAKKKNHWSDGRTGMFEVAEPDKIIWKVNRDANSYMLEFKKQKLDVSTYLEMKALLELEKSEEFTKNFNYAFMPTYNYSYAAFNLKPDGIKQKKLFTDAKVRWALAKLTPINDMNKVCYANKAQRAIGPVPLLKKEYYKGLKPIDFDLEGAKKLLAEAGWKDADGDGVLEKMIDGEKVKFEFNLSFMNTTSSWKDIAQLMSESFNKAGIKANLDPIDFNVMQDKARNHNFDMIILAWQSTTAPDDHDQIWSTKSWATKGSNFTGWGNAVSDALIDSMKYELDDAKRTAISARFQKMVYDDQPYIFIFTSTRRIAYNKKYGEQEMYYDKPGILLNHMKLSGSIAKPTAEN